MKEKTFWITCDNSNDNEQIIGSYQQRQTKDCGNY